MTSEDRELIKDLAASLEVLSQMATKGRPDFAPVAEQEICVAVHLVQKAHNHLARTEEAHLRYVEVYKQTP